MRELLERTKDYYSAKIQQYGNTNLGVDWNSKESQWLRFVQLSKILRIDNDNSTLCDFGCGYGAYVDFLLEQGICVEYTGIDISELMIDYARANHENNNVKFIVGNTCEKNYDYIVASGIFNVKQDAKNEEWNKYVFETLDMFNRCSTKGFAINCLTSYSDKEYMKEYLYYANPSEWFDYAKRNYSRNVAILHDYDLYEFTMLVRK